MCVLPGPSGWKVRPWEMSRTGRRSEITIKGWAAVVKENWNNPLKCTSYSRTNCAYRWWSGTECTLRISASPKQLKGQPLLTFYTVTVVTDCSGPGGFAAKSKHAYSVEHWDPKSILWSQLMTTFTFISHTGMLCVVALCSPSLVPHRENIKYIMHH